LIRGEGGHTLLDYSVWVIIVGAFLILFYIIITLTPMLKKALEEHPAIIEVLRLLKDKIKSVFIPEES